MTYHESTDLLARVRDAITDATTGDNLAIGFLDRLRNLLAEFDRAALGENDDPELPF